MQKRYALVDVTCRRFALGKPDQRDPQVATRDRSVVRFPWFEVSRAQRGVGSDGLARYPVVCKRAVAAVVRLALAHVAQGAGVRSGQVVRTEAFLVAGDAASADLGSRIGRRGMRIVAGSAPEFLAAGLGAAAQRQLFDVAHDLKAALLVCIAGGTYEDGPELFQSTAWLE